MSRVFIGDYPFNGTFEAGIAGPMDARYIVENYADLVIPDTWPSGIADAYIYEGMQVYVREDKKVYVLTDAANYQSTDSWKELASDIEGTQVEIADNLTTDRGDIALSARQGKQLNTQFREFHEQLLVDDKINPDLLPQFNTGLLYGGTIDGKGMCILTTALKEKLNLTDDVIEADIRELSINALKDVYFIAKEAGDKISYTGLEVPKRSAGDWIISTGAKWEKISSNAVTSVVGKTGAVTANDITKAIIYPGGNVNPVGYVASHTEILRLEGVTEDINREISTIKDDISSVSESLTWKTI